MKKICVIHHTALLGGGTKSFIDIINMMKDKNYVIACIPKGSKELINLLKNNNINYYEIIFDIPVFPYYSGGSSLFSKSSFKALLKLKKEQQFVDEITALKPDVLLFNSVITCISARKFSPKIKKICFVRETFKRTLFDDIYRKILESYFNGVCFIAESEQRYLSLKKSITGIVPDCLEPKDINIYSKEEACKIDSIDSSRFNVLFLGGMDYLKGADVIFEAMSYLSEEYYLIMGGYFDENLLKFKSILSHFYSPRLVKNRLKLRKYYIKLQKENRLKYMGFRKDISSIVCACDVVVFPSNEAHQPRPGIEAGEYKKTVIISDFEATKEYFVDGYNAVVFKPHNSKDLAEKIINLNNDRKKLKILGENNYLMTKKLHNYFKIKNKLKKFLESIID